jgi:hypothetical protein
MQVPQIRVEQAMARVIRGAGGEIVSDLLPARANLAKNADYVFREYGVIAELKRLEKDQDDDEEFREKRNQLYRTWVDQCKVPPIFGTIRIELRNLPPDCALEFVSLYREPIRRPEAHPAVPGWSICSMRVPCAGDQRRTGGDMEWLGRDR